MAAHILLLGILLLTSGVYSQSSNSSPTVTAGSTPAAATGPTALPANTTGVPSANTTGVPTANATGVPSANATGVPSANTTGVPTANATGVPSANATGVPSANATGVPSANATGVASANATGVASANATGVTTVAIQSGSEVERKIDDIYNLDEWQNNTDWFGSSFFGALSSYPIERYTIQRLLYILKKNNEPSATKTEPLELTTKLMRGYFAALPDYLNSTGGQQTLQGIGYLIEKDLEEITIDNLNNCVKRKETCFYGGSMSETDEWRWLVERVNWQRIIVKALIARRYEDDKPADVDQQCYTDTVYTLRAFYKGERWAQEMVDASGKPQVGAFQGNLNWIGQYDQCNLIVPNITAVRTEFAGSYCDIKMKMPESFQALAAPGQTIYLQMGLCFPSTCGATDVRSIMGNLTVLGFQLPEIVSSRCHSDSPSANGKFSTDGVAHFAAVFMGIFVALVIICTIVEGVLWYETDDDVITKKKASAPAVEHEKKGIDNNGYANGGIELKQVTLMVEENGNGHAYDTSTKGDVVTDEKSNHNVQTTETEISTTSPTSAAPASTQPLPAPQEGMGKKLVCVFSLYTNVPALLATVQPRGALKSLDALRVFNMNWIILGHMFSIGAVFMPETMANAKLAAEKIKDTTFMGVYTGMLAVDSYFFISGLLVSYIFMKTSAKNKGKWGMQLVLYYIHRLWRILPLYMIVILVYAAFGQYLGSGPLFDWQSDRVRDCNNNWWANLLFINNFYKPKEMCLGWSWYLANDMQFYIVAPTILIPLFLKPIIGGIIVLLYFAIHWTVTAVLWKNTGGNSYLQDPDIFYEAYITPYCRIGPYLVGLILGWIFYKGYKVKQPIVIILGWVSSLAVMGTIVYVQHDDVKDYGVIKPNWNTAQRTIYETLSRDAWALCMAWIVYACNYGYAGFVGHILNWKGWTPLGRMTFAVYLVHPIVIFIYAGNRRDLNYLDDFSVSFMYAGYVILSYVGGAILSLVYEWPFTGLDKLVLGNLRKSKSS